MISKKGMLYRLILSLCLMMAAASLPATHTHPCQTGTTLALVEFAGTLLGPGYYPSIHSDSQVMAAIKATAQETHLFYANTYKFVQTGTVYHCYGILYIEDTQWIGSAAGKRLRLDVEGPSAAHPTGRGRWFVEGQLYQDWLPFYLPVVINVRKE